jgi:hypothetical protein
MKKFQVTITITITGKEVEDIEDFLYKPFQESAQKGMVKIGNKVLDEVKKLDKAYWSQHTNEGYIDNC